MENIKIKISIQKLPLYAVSHKNGRKTLEIQAFDGILTVSVQYDYERAPLSLNAEIKEGDAAEVILTEPRIELYINGELKDEEWPCVSSIYL